MPVYARSGPATVLGSGVITTFRGHTLVLDAEWSHGRRAIELAFVLGSAGDEPRVDASMGDDGRIALTCYGFEAELGKGTAEPIHVESAGGVSLFLHFRSMMFGRSDDWTVVWTFYEAPDEPGS